MAEELQSLLDRIQQDGIDKAEATSKQIVTSAQEKADTIITEARKNAEELLIKAEANAVAFEGRAKKSLEQASRDILIATESAISDSMQSIVTNEITASLDDETLKKMLVDVVKAYSETGETRMEIMLSPDQQKTAIDLFMSKYKEQLDKGLEITADNNLISGFTIKIIEQNIQHDFTVEAISEAFCHLLRPALIDIMRNAHKKDQSA